MGGWTRRPKHAVTERLRTGKGRSILLTKFRNTGKTVHGERKIDFAHKV